MTARTSCLPRAFLLVALLLAVLLPAAVVAGDLHPRFFYQGSGKLIFHNLRNGLETTVSLLDEDGQISEAGLQEADWVLGYPGAEKKEHFSPRLLFVLSHFVDRLAPGAKITVESAYRSPEYNEGIRTMGANAARTSTHIDGMAIDFAIDGIDGKELWELIRQEKCCGVGYYGGKDIHLDVGRPRFWQAATSGTKTSQPDHNRHAYLAAEYDRYLAGEKIRLALSGLSTFGFALRPDLFLRAVADGGQLPIKIRLSGDESCIKVENYQQSRFLWSEIPAGLPPGRYQLQLGFCAKPFADMPDEILSRPFEVVKEMSEPSAKSVSPTSTNGQTADGKTQK